MITAVTVHYSAKLPRKTRVVVVNIENASCVSVVRLRGLEQIRKQNDEKIGSEKLEVKVHHIFPVPMIGAVYGGDRTLEVKRKGLPLMYDYCRTMASSISQEYERVGIDVRL